LRHEELVRFRRNERHLDPAAGLSSFQFEITLSPSVGVRLLRRAVLVLGVAGLVLSAWLAYGREEGWWLIGFGLLTVWAGWQHGRRGLAWGHLRVDADGAASWRDLDRAAK